MEVNYRYPSFALIDAIKRNDIEYIRKSDVIDDPLIFAEAVYYGRVEIIFILIQKGYPIDYWACHHAIRSGRTNMITLLQKLGIWSKYYKDSKLLTSEDFGIYENSDDE